MGKVWTLFRQNEWYLIGVITALGLILRQLSIGSQSLWFDELLSVSISRLPFQNVLTSPASIDPPLYYILLHFWLALSRDDGWLRLVSAFAGIMAIPSIFILARRLFDHRVGYVSAAMTAIAPLQIYFAQEVRMYTLLFLFSIWAIWAYDRAQEREQKRDWIIWIFLMTLALYTHNFAGLILVALDSDALLRWLTKRKSLVPGIIANAIIGVLFLPWLVLFFSKLSWLAPALWLQPPSVVNLLMTFYLFVFGYTLGFPASGIAMFIFLAAMAFTLLSGWQVLRRGISTERDNMRLSLLAALFPPVCLFLISQWRSAYVDRLLLESAPALYILLAWGIVQSSRRRMIQLIALVGLPFMLWALVNYFTQSEYARPPLRDVIAQVAVLRRSDEIIIHTSDSSFLAGRFYDGLGDHQLLYHPADQWLTPALMDDLQVPYDTDIQHLLAGRSSFWLIVALDHIPDEQRSEKAKIDRLGWLAEERLIGGVGVYHYRLP